MYELSILGYFLYITYIMALFDANINALNEYRNNPRIKEATEGFVMLTRKEFTDWFKSTERTRSKSKKSMTISNAKLITELLISVCRKSIGVEYLKSTVGHVIPYRSKGQKLPKSKFDPLTREIREMYFDARHDDKFDLLVCVKQDVYEASKPTQDEKTDAVVSFIVSELGECKKRPKSMSVNLICSRDVKGFKGYFLLAAMMYCVKNSKYTKEVILELTGKYSGNIGGFKSYSRVGFDRDPSLYGFTCFDDIDNLPMSVRVDILKEEQIIAYAIENRPSSEIKEELGKHFYLLPKIDKDLSMKIGEIADFYHELDVGVEPDSEVYKGIVTNAKSETVKKQRLLDRIKALTPQNTPSRISRSHKRKAEESVSTTVKSAKKKLKKVSTERKSPGTPRKKSRSSPKRSTRSNKPKQPRSASRGRVGSRIDD